MLREHVRVARPSKRWRNTACLLSTLHAISPVRQVKLVVWDQIDDATPPVCSPLAWSSLRLCTQVTFLGPEPSARLVKLVVKDSDLLSDDTIGGTEINLIDRFYSPQVMAAAHSASKNHLDSPHMEPSDTALSATRSRPMTDGGAMFGNHHPLTVTPSLRRVLQWRKLGCGGSSAAPVMAKPLERRTLRLDGQKSGRGKLEVWVDILTEDEAARHPPQDISKTAGEHFEIRIVVWRAKNFPLLDSATEVSPCSKHRLSLT